MTEEKNQDNMKIDMPEPEQTEMPGMEELLKILIDLNMSQSQIQNSKTAIHEIAHATLHDIDLNQPEISMEERKDRKTKEVEAVQKERIEEEMLLSGEQNSFGIYQLKEDEELHYHRFEGLERLKNHRLKVEKDNYDLIYTAPL